MGQAVTMTPPPSAEDQSQYTDAQLSDGRTLRFKGQLNPDQVRQKVAEFRSKEGGASSPAAPQHGAFRRGLGWLLGTLGPDADQYQHKGLVEEFQNAAESERDKYARGQHGIGLTAPLGTFVMGSLADAAKIERGMASPGNVAAGTAAAVFPPARLPIGLYYAATGALDAFTPRNDDPQDPDYETEADYVQRVLLDTSQVAGSAALMKAPRRTAAGEQRYRLNKATFATGGGNPEFTATLGDIDETLRQTKAKVKTVADVQDLVKATERRLNQHFEQALFPLRGNKMVPTQIADALEAKANQSNLQMTPEGRRTATMYKKAATNFQQEWTLEQLDLERRRLFDARLARKGSVEQSVSRRASTSLDIDQVIEDQIRDLEYSELNRRYPGQKFQDLKFRQSQLVELKRTLEKRVIDLKNAQGKAKGAPALSGEHGTGTVSKHGLLGRVSAKIPGQGPETQANIAARKAFRRPGAGTRLAPLGRPTPPPGTVGNFHPEWPTERRAAPRVETEPSYYDTRFSELRQHLRNATDPKERAELKRQIEELKRQKAQAAKKGNMTAPPALPESSEEPPE